MYRRLELDTILRSICPNVYYQPPESVKIKYPCIVYSLSTQHVTMADDIKYKKVDRYNLTLIDKNPDTSLRFPIEDLPYCSFDRTFVSDNLNHYAYTLYF